MLRKIFMAMVLIIEEEEKVRKSLVRIFRQEGLERCDGARWEDVDKLLGENVYDLIVVDLCAKLFDGYEMVKTIKLCNHSAEVVVIMHQNEYDIGRMLGYGVYDCVLKPFRQKDIVDVGRKALEKKRLADKVRNLEQIMGMG